MSDFPHLVWKLLIFSNPENFQYQTLNTQCPTRCLDIRYLVLDIEYFLESCG